MADPVPVPADDTPNPFDGLAPRPIAEAVPAAGAAATPASAPANDDTAENPFDKLAPRPVAEGAAPEGSSSATGAFVRGAERGALPAAGGFVGMGAGAALGAAAGAFGGPFAPVTVPAGTIIGGIAGAFVGAGAVDAAQNWLLSKAPDSWKEAIGQDERQRNLDETQHPYASYLGGITPFVATMRPGPLLGGALPENATALQRILANPMTGRMFGGGAMGGIEIGQEIASGESPDWTKVGIATGFGFVFNKPTKLGQSLTEIGARPARALVGARPVPTVAQAGDLQVLGPGINEDVFMGTHEQAPEAKSTSQATAQTEKQFTEPPEVDVNTAARKLEPELFERWDALHNQQAEIRNWMDEHTNPPDEHVQEASGRVEALEKQLAEHVESQNGYTGGAEARRLRAQLRDAEGQRDILLTRRANYIEGQIAESPEAAQARKHMMDIDYQMRDLSDEVRAAYRRAAERGQTETAEPARAAVETVPDSTFNADSAHGLERSFFNPEYDGAPIELSAAGFTPTEIEAMEKAGLASNGQMSREQFNVWDAERGARVKRGVASSEPTLTPEGEAAKARRQAGAAASAPKTVAEQKAAIAADVAAKLVAAGRPEAEAVALGHVYAVQIARRSARFAGKRGTPEELYRTEGADIRGEGQPPAPAAPSAPAAPEARAPSAEAAPAPVAAAAEPSAALPKGFETWTPGAKVKFGPIAGLTVQGFKDGKFTVTTGRQTWEIEPPARMPKDENDISLLQHMHEIRGAEPPPAPVTETVTLPAAVEPPKPTGPAHSFDDAIKTEREAIRAAGKNKRTKIKDLNELARFNAFQKEAGLDLRDIMAEQPEVDRGFFESLYKTYRREPGETPGRALWRAIDERATEIERTMPVALDAQMRHDMQVLEDHFKSESARGHAAGSYNMRSVGESGRFIPGETHFGSGPSIAEGAFENEREFTQAAPHGGGAVEGGRAAPGEGGRIEEAGSRPEDGGAPRGEGDAIGEGREFEQGHLGKIKIQGGTRSVITLMKDANASTAIHEFGHDFFEQLDRDSRHEAAPADLKADAAVLRKWAGAKEDGPISRGAHEKAARGFERYMREGVAPSRELAGVFEQFKNWLVAIYRSVKDLRAPINDDIRRVFDRMLAAEPETAVVAGERPAESTLAGIHEADAAETPPEQAPHVADRVASEIASTVETPPPQVAHEIEAAITKVESEAGAKSGGENGAGGPESGKVEQGSGGPGAESGRGGVGAGDSKVVGGGGTAAAEGGGVSGPERKSGSDAGPPLAPGAKPFLGGGDSPFVDKAGNIRLENLTNEQEVRQAIHDSAERNYDFVGARDGVVTDGMVDDMAAAIGMEGARDLVKKWVVGQAYNAGQVMAIRKLALQSSAEVSRLSKVAAIGSDEDVRAFMQEVLHHDMIVKTLAGATAEAGRALRAFRNISEGEAAGGLDPILRDSAGMTLFQARRAAKLMSTLDTPEQVSRQMQAMGKRTAGRMVLEEWINALISGPPTHVTYTIGNMLLALEKAGPETAVAALIGKVRAAMGREGETVRMGEVAAGLRGGLRGISPAMKAGFDALRTGVTTMLPGESLRSRTVMPFQPGAELVQPAIMDEAAKFSDAMGSAFGIIRGIRDGIVAQGALLKAGGEAGAPFLHGNYSQLGAIPDIAVKGATVLPVGTLIRLPSRAIAGIHSFFRSVNYSIEKSAGAYRTAANEGHTGLAFDARVGDLWQNPTEEQMESYRHEATEATLMGAGSKFTQALGRLTNTEVFGFPLLKFIDPFVHISSNVIDQSIIQRTPVGLLSPELRKDLMGKNGTIAQDKAQARMLVGTALAVTFGGLAAEGMASGSGPSDPREAAMWRQAGNQAHSIRIGDVWYDTHRLGPLGMLMGIGADMYDVAHTAAKEDLLHAAAHLQHALTQNVLDESFMRGPSDLIRAIEDPGRYGDAYIRNFLSSFVPYSVGLAQVNRGIDPYSRQARTVVDAIKAKIPGLSQDLLPRRDIWGEPMPNREALLSAGATAIYETHVNTDPVNLAMVQLGVFPAQPERKIRNVQLTDQQYDYYAMIAGRTAKMRLDAIVRSPDWQQMPDHIRRDIVQEQIRQSRDAAREVTIARDPTIAVRAMQQKVDKAMGVPVP